ncbi:hypothetical protein BAUCODRAFT_70727 [Baudoinia panamericana UAMH 10762]|uniref:U6 small nuclear RNA (adenine-(43)-N(6))-methyltransferase n=1 Tax=Baudoinia panamericana (strain UAMH 10762) TaxID=717646 RepID=M2LPQ9_BAUPA|nr:uncharacterized protein BAUCODRAFT_70727 [Baudoinia panamericana UAMH 10762]EMC96392.1 hypothetical protein BAUCODRAFT_70727 [Baudoinia panamericana UAMH 10762]
MPPSSVSSVEGGRPYYDGDVDFDALAAEDADFAAICKVSKDKRWIDFQDPKVVQQLTKSLLKCDFALSLELPNDRLCPPVPVRWNYVRWIQELLDTTSGDYRDHYDPEREVLGLDIGVGASCIYPLLACSMRPEWRMAGTDVDQHSFDYARKNVEANGLAKRIKLRLSTSDRPLIPLDSMKIEGLDFVMTNPPFYTSHTDMLASYAGKQAPPSAVCTGADNEMICPGGDVGFVTRILDESLKLRERVQWYSAMLGKMSSLQQLIAKLREHNITNFAVTCLQAGYRTKRWAVAWSFRDLRPRNDVARHGDLVHAVLPSPTAQTIPVPLMSAQFAGDRVSGILQELDVRWQWREAIFTGVMKARENVWSRAARRKKKFQAERDIGRGEVDAMQLDGDEGDADDDENVALAVKIVCKLEVVEVRWLRGHDHVLFTSFCGMLKRGLTGRA